MEKIRSICVMRELIKAMAELESQLQNRYGLSSNEAMALCCIARNTLTASSISESIGLTPSNTSKVLRSLENKGMISRSLGETDHRQMCFSLTDIGLGRLQILKNEGIEIPAFIKPLFAPEKTE